MICTKWAIRNGIIVYLFYIIYNNLDINCNYLISIVLFFVIIRDIIKILIYQILVKTHDIKSKL
jgi:hypothetical protein